MRQFIEDERLSRTIEWHPKALFLNRKEDGNPRRGTGSIIAKRRAACQKPDLVLNPKGAYLAIRINRSQTKTDLAVGIGHCLTYKVALPWKFKTFLRKEKQGAVCATLENNLVSNKIFTDVKTTRSDAFVRFARPGRADPLPFRRTSNSSITGQEHIVGDATGKPCRHWHTF
jgi:hypothetical protein